MAKRRLRRLQAPRRQDPPPLGARVGVVVLHVVADLVEFPQGALVDLEAKELEAIADLGEVNGLVAASEVTSPLPSGTGRTWSR